MLYRSYQRIRHGSIILEALSFNGMQNRGIWSSSLRWTRMWSRLDVGEVTERSRRDSIDTKIEDKGIRKCLSRRFCSEAIETRQFNCWSCGSDLSPGQFFCSACNSIQDPEMLKRKDVTFFDLFELKHDFDVDQKSLEKKYWNIQKNLHPDKFGGKSQVEQEYSTENSMLLNEAYSTLKTPLLRATYMLQKKGIDALSEGGATATDPELLMWAMEEREALEESLDDESGEKLKEILKNVKLKLKQVEEQLIDAFRDGNYDAATKYAVRMKYMDKVREEAHQYTLDRSLQDKS